MMSNDQSLTIYGEPVRGRSCGSCKLCCTLLPVELHPGVWKKAHEPCTHLNRRGCGIYPDRPITCRYWSCRWLFDPLTADLRRPDHTHYVIDSMPDEIRLTDDDTGETRLVGVVQVWVDPAHREAWRDPPLLAYLQQMAALYRMATILRFTQSDILTVFPPPITDDHQWHERTGQMSDDVGFYARHPLDNRPPI